MNVFQKVVLFLKVIVCLLAQRRFEILYIVANNLANFYQEQEPCPIQASSKILHHLWCYITLHYIDPYYITFYLIPSRFPLYAVCSNPILRPFII